MYKSAAAGEVYLIARGVVQTQMCVWTFLSVASTAHHQSSVYLLIKDHQWLSHVYKEPSCAAVAYGAKTLQLSVTGVIFLNVVTLLDIHFCLLQCYSQLFNQCHQYPFNICCMCEKEYNTNNIQYYQSHSARAGTNADTALLN